MYSAIRHLAAASVTLPSWLEWLHHPKLVVALSVGLLVVGIGCVLSIPLVIARIPADYFARQSMPGPSDAAHWFRRILRNVVGWVFLLLGIAMLVLPGQGLLTILIAIVLIDFPGKRRLERWLLLRPRVIGVLNSIRKRAGREPFEVDACRHSK